MVMPLVAVVEDDPASQKTLARVLRVGGYEAALYASAEEFLASPPQSISDWTAAGRAPQRNVRPRPSAPAEKRRINDSGDHHHGI